MISFFNDTTENYTKHYVFTIGHCAGHCTGTVRALCGHCTGTVEASKTCDVAAWAKFSDCLEAAIWFTRHVIPCQAARQDSLLRPSNQTRISDSPLSSLHRVALDSTFDECSRDCLVDPCVSIFKSTSVQTASHNGGHLCRYFPPMSQVCGAS